MDTGIRPDPGQEATDDPNTHAQRRGATASKDDLSFGAALAQEDDRTGSD